MEYPEVLEELKGYISREILDGKDMGLDETTPLLEWGIINSMEIARLVTFIQERFGYEISDDEITPEHFINLSALSHLVMDIAGASYKSVMGCKCA
jgi:acyl carrier protein